MSYSRKSSLGWKEISEQIRKRIVSGELAPGQKLASEAEFAKEMGVAKLTIRRAFSKLAADGIVKSVERVGTFVAESGEAKARRVGLFLPAKDGFLEFGFLSGIREALGSGKQILLFGTDNDPVTEWEMIEEASGEVDGILIMPTCHPKITGRLELLNESGCPVVCIDRHPESSRLASVTTDHYGVTRQALADLHARGHRQIGYFGWLDRRMSSVAERYRGYTDFMAESGLGDPRALTRFVNPKGPDDLYFEQMLVRDSLASLLGRPDPITAIFCANEHFMFVISELLAEFQTQVGAPFEISSFCDWPRISAPGVRLNLIRQDVRQIGFSAARLLDKALEVQSPATGQVRVPAISEQIENLIG